ncbi:D-alanyl-D-alanine carboxypeptidase family protein [Virgibacillus dokdonensis]|uniref:D-alanyl-D-alanine carboxypeptidase n=1 Tax=Virgibacillus dokdonensis TaxID=302167 RepID=A0A2K9IXP9_9BACI|nr:D-alanyl-D-alanine carboxypeptidase family protein [Virgibacillus dokdonensis]AUJ24522.1 D-alanyl-D-alanine carboxypeptidase [Virgibacillus dokdonensis]
MKRKHIISFIVLLFVLVFTSACGNDDKEQQADKQSKAEDNTENTMEELQLPEAALQKLDSGEDVKALQLALKEIGYDIKDNGDFDAATVWAITDLQMQKDLPLTGIYEQETAEVVKQLVEDGSHDFEPGKKLPAKAEPATTDSGTNVIANPYEQLVLVNKENALPADYTPVDLVVPDINYPFTEDLPKKKVRKIAATAIEDLFAAADKAGLELFAQSGYRSYDRQETVFASNVQSLGEEQANQVSARPGESEHQTGLTMDVTSRDMGFQLNEDFANTDEGKWLAENAAEYGFIIRFPKGKEEITQYQYEPWHIRYVGKKAAKEITENELTLEEYLTAE